MATTKTKTELTRLAWITELRRQGHRQCKGTRRDGNVCALALLGELVGDPAPWPFCPLWSNRVVNVAGLTHEQAADVIGMNDHQRLPFAQIADVIAGWFPS